MRQEKEQSARRTTRTRSGREPRRTDGDRVGAQRRFEGFNTLELVRTFCRDEEGQDVVEYGLLVATIALIVLVRTTAFGGDVSAFFTGLAAMVLQAS